MGQLVMEIRPYEPADEAAVIALWREALIDPAPHNDPQISLQNKIAVDPELLLVAVVNCEVIGTVMGGYDGHRGWIYSVAVQSTCRRQGIGSALVRRLEMELGRRGCLKVNLQVRSKNTGVIPFYESLGFQVEEIVSLGKRLYE